MIKEKENPNVKNGHPDECAEWILPVRDALDVLYGRWKLPIIISLTFGDKRFTQIRDEIPGLTDKSLSKELKELEGNQLITRTVFDTFPPRVMYSITAHGRSLEKVINELRDWGNQHREKIINS
ncbi:winged helix-turn-helix transcriptional regulator [Autumnicola musiva]|uniref:Helix-turn-helix domain-containing protein n=1 Tax=Autumnicola musiva TaxID=3075589 RepID=A0ABU3D9B9_9FLAO|nr:helix-turn-helix domain-containing protein [Zunongwangia sp. F117]MDT0677944.1 helix-turn-helix domain-containing protein [Zunongwangia sp. F117]